MTEQLTQIRRALFARRNGVVADALKQAGDPHTYIMGTPLSELITLAAELPHNPQVAQAPWNDRNHRECRLLATMLMPKQDIDAHTAGQWAHDVITHEEADILCHRLLRHLPYAQRLIQPLLDSDNDLHRYTALRLIINLLDNGKLTHPLPYDLTPLHNQPRLKPLLQHISQQA